VLRSSTAVTDQKKRRHERTKGVKTLEISSPSCESCVVCSFPHKTQAYKYVLSVHCF
jgi:hypothetical protein